MPKSLKPKAEPSSATVLTIVPPNGQILTDAENTLAIAQDIAVDSPSASRFAQGMRAGIDQRIKELNDERLSITRPLDAAKESIMTLFRRPVEVLTQCKRDLDRKILNYANEQQRIARDEQRRLDEIAEKEKQRLQKLADKAEARGQHDKAEEFLDRAATTVAPYVEPETARAHGTAFVETWHFEIVDPDQVLIKCPDEKEIGRIVRSLHAEAQAIVGKGVRIFSSKTVVTRRN